VVAKNQHRCTRITIKDLSNLVTNEGSHALNLSTKLSPHAQIADTFLGSSEVETPRRLRLTAFRIEHYGKMRQGDVHEDNGGSAGLDRASVDLRDTVDLAKRDIRPRTP
jgi:hypothetical protein